MGGAFSDEFLACTLSYVETNFSASQLMRITLTDEAKTTRLGSRMAVACSKHL